MSNISSKKQLAIDLHDIRVEWFETTGRIMQISKVDKGKEKEYLDLTTSLRGLNGKLRDTISIGFANLASKESSSDFEDQLKEFREPLKDITPLLEDHKAMVLKSSRRMYYLFGGLEKSLSEDDISAISYVRNLISEEFTELYNDIQSCIDHYKKYNG